MRALRPWPPGHLLCWLLGPHRLSFHLPWAVDSVSPLSQEGGQAVESRARLGLACLAQLLSGPALALWFPLLPMGMV